MNSKFLETFVWLATLKSYQRTAERLNTSQPVVSSRIAALEKALGVSLCEGSGSTFALTPAGARMIEKSEAIVLMVQELESIARGTQEPDRPLRIGVAEIVAISWLPEFIHQLDLDLPRMPVDVRAGVLKELMDHLRSGELDMVFVVGTVNEPDIKSTPLCQFPVKWVANPSVVDTRREIDVVELAKLPIIMSTRISYRYEKTIEYFQAHNVLTIARAGNIHTFDGGYSLLTCAHLARRGLGVTPLPVQPIATLLDGVDLVIVPVRQPMAPWQVVACSKTSARPDLMEAIVTAAKTVIERFAERNDIAYFST